MLFVTAAGRLARPAVVVLLVVLLPLLVTAPARAAGTGGIEVTPLTEPVDGAAPTSFRVDVPSDGTERVPFLVRNVDDQPRSARLFVAPVRRDGDSFALGEPDASEWVEYEARDVTLQPGESQEHALVVRGGKLPDDEVLAAVVVQVRSGSVVQRASTLIYLDEGRRVPLPLLVVLVAVLLAVAAAIAWSFVVRRRRPEAPSPQSV
ncbi:MAG: hypothetical protein ACLGIG_01165 [Actinomycetes bacterium]